jgi:hypothetical protein
MDPPEYKRARKHFDLPSTTFSTLLGIGWRQGRRYRDGDCVIPNAAVIAAACNCYSDLGWSAALAVHGINEASL